MKLKGDKGIALHDENASVSMTFWGGVFCSFPMLKKDTWNQFFRLATNSLQPYYFRVLFYRIHKSGLKQLFAVGS